MVSTNADDVSETSTRCAKRTLRGKTRITAV
jgi:hypothetical protein